MSLSVAYIVVIRSKRIADGTGAALPSGCFGIPTFIRNDTGLLSYILLAIVSSN